MYTRCPQCKTVHQLNAELLSHARGLVQCGECSRTFSALSFLFDDWPSGAAFGPAKGPDAVPPILEIESKKDEPESESSETGETDEQPRESKRLAWILATALLALLTLANTLWTFREPLLETPRIKTWLAATDKVQNEQHGLLKDPQQVQLVSRDMHTHPTRSGILVLSLTFVNLAQRSQIYPDLEVTLLDAANQPVARRRLQPPEYLRDEADVDAGLTADVFLPVLLEFGDPGEQAVGFEIRFL